MATREELTEQIPAAVAALDRVVITMSGKFLPHDWRRIEP